MRLVINESVIFQSTLRREAHEYQVRVDETSNVSQYRYKLANNVIPALMPYTTTLDELMVCTDCQYCDPSMAPLSLGHV